MSDGPALRDTMTVLRAWMEIAGAGPGATFANEMTGWLREEGFEHTKEVHVDVEMGPSCEDAEWGARSAQVMVSAATGVAGACKSMLPDLCPCPHLSRFRGYFALFC